MEVEVGEWKAKKIGEQMQQKITGKLMNYVKKYEKDLSIIFELFPFDYRYFTKKRRKVSKHFN